MTRTNQKRQLTDRLLREKQLIDTKIKAIAGLPDGDYELFNSPTSLSIQIDCEKYLALRRGLRREWIYVGRVHHLRGVVEFQHKLNGRLGLTVELKDKETDDNQTLARGTQIIFTPTHAEGNLDHPDCEAGFVTSATELNDSVFCRYWSKYTPDGLRTKSNSELTPVYLLVIKDTVPQEQVDKALEEYCT